MLTGNISGNGFNGSPDNGEWRPDKVAEASEPFTIALLHGAWHRHDSWQYTRESLEGDPLEPEHEVITPDLPADDTNASFESDAALVDEELKGKTNIILVGHSRGAELIPYIVNLRQGRTNKGKDDGIDHIVGAVAVSHGGAHSIQFDPEVERYTPEFRLGIVRDASSHTSTFKPDVAREVFYDDVPDPRIVDEACEQLRRQRDLQEADKASTLLVPDGIPYYWLTGAEDRVHVRERVNRVVEHLRALRPQSGLDFVELPSGHTPQLSIPHTLASVIVYLAHDAKLKKAGVN